MRCEDSFASLPRSGGEGDHAKHGGGVTGAGIRESRSNLGLRAFYPSTTLRVVPLPISDGEER
jgi:hypothetical protein